MSTQQVNAILCFYGSTTQHSIRAFHQLQHHIKLTSGIFEPEQFQHHIDKERSCYPQMVKRYGMDTAFHA